jgi:hypothetical protein
MLKKFLLLFIVNLKISFIQKGMNIVDIFNKFNTFNDFFIYKQSKMPWNENYLALIIKNYNMLSFIYDIHKPHLVFIGSILKKIEDILIFQTINNTKATKLDLILDVEFFQEDVLVNGLKNIITYKPFFIALTNEISNNNPKLYVNKYYYSNIYRKNYREQNILCVTVADNVIENLEIFDSLFDKKEKILFLHHMNNKTLFSGKDMGFFLSILGTPIYHNIFSNGQTILFYGDSNKCIHNIFQQVGFAIYLNKNLKFQDIVISHNNICTNCLNIKKNFPLDTKNKRLNFLSGLGFISKKIFYFKDFLLNSAYKSFKNKYSNVFKLISNEITLKEAIDLTCFVMKNIENPKSVEYYSKLLFQLFFNKKTIELNELFAIFETEDFVINDLIPQEISKS